MAAARAGKSKQSWPRLAHGALTECNVAFVFLTIVHCSMVCASGCAYEWSPSTCVACGRPMQSDPKLGWPLNHQPCMDQPWGTHKLADFQDIQPIHSLGTINLTHTHSSIRSLAFPLWSHIHLEQNFARVPHPRHQGASTKNRLRWWSQWWFRSWRIPISPTQGIKIRAATKLMAFGLPHCLRENGSQCIHSTLIFLAQKLM